MLTKSRGYLLICRVVSVSPVFYSQTSNLAQLELRFKNSEGSTDQSNNEPRSTDGQNEQVADKILLNLNSNVTVKLI